MSEPNHPNSLPQLLHDLRDEGMTLLRQEVALAKAEMKESMRSAATDAVQVAIGGFIGYAGVIVLLIGLGLLISALLVRAGMDRDLAQWLAPTGLGIIVAVIGWIMAARGKNAMAQRDLKSQQTITTVREDKDWAQNKLQHSHEPPIPDRNRFASIRH